MSRNEKGFSVIEALMGIFLLGIVLTGVLPAFLSFLDANTYSEQASDSVSAAQQMLERLRLQDPASMPTSGADSAVIIPVGGREYEVINSYCVNPAFCGAGSRHITVEVNYGGEPRFVVESVFTRLQ